MVGSPGKGRGLEEDAACTITEQKDQNETIETTETVIFITSDTKQLLDEVFVKSGIIKVKVIIIRRS